MSFVLANERLAHSPTRRKRNDIAKYNEFFSILSAIKRCFSRSPTHRSALQGALQKDTIGPRGGKRYCCAICGQSYGIKEVQVDHKDPIIPLDTLSKDMSWDEIIKRTFCSENNLQVLCTECHKLKSKGENMERKEEKKKKKDKGKGC